MPQETVNKLLTLIDTSVNDFVDGLNAIEREQFKELLSLLKQLDTDPQGNIRNNLNNVQLIGKIKKKMDSLVLSDPYLSKVSSFTASFNAVADLQNNYFAAISDEFRPFRILEVVKELNIDNTVNLLTENGISANYTDGIKEILRVNITSGGSYADLVNVLRDNILGKEGEDGSLTKYAKQVATDSINQYSAQYTHAVTQDLGLEWFQYVGSIIKTSRQFCRAMCEKRYFHISEVPSILNGNIDGHKVSLAGLFPDTNQDNFFILRGGYQCGHQIYPVSSASVPKELRDRFGG